MILIALIELIVSIIASVLFFTGVWVPSTVFIGFMMITWIISSIAALIREGR